MSRKFVVIGLGDFGLSVASTLTNLGQDVLGIDKEEKIIQAAIDEGKIENGIVLDATQKLALERAGIDSSFDVGVVGVGSDPNTSILITMFLKEFGIKKVIAKATTAVQVKVLLKIGADRVILPEVEMGSRLARELVQPNIFHDIILSPNYSIMEFKATKPFLGKSIKEIGFRPKYQANIIGIKGSGGKVIINPSADYVIEENDILIMIIHNERKRELEKLT